MGTHIEHTVTIEQPVATVYQHFLDLDRHPSEPGVASVAKTPAGATRPGTSFRFTYVKGPDTSMRFTELEADRRIAFEGSVGPLSPAGALVFEPLAGATRVTVRVDPRPAMALRPLSPLIRRKGRQIWQARFARVKAALEAPTPPRDPATGARV